MVSGVGYVGGWSRVGNGEVIGVVGGWEASIVGGVDGGEAGDGVRRRRPRGWCRSPMVTWVVGYPALPFGIRGVGGGCRRRP